MKKVLFIVGAFVFLGFAQHVFAQGFVPLAEIPGLTDPTTANTPGFANFFNNLYKYLVGLAAILAVIMIIWGGLEYSTQDSISKKSDGKERIYQALFGLVLVLSPVLVFSIINPNILNLSLNLKPLDTASGTTSPPCPAGQTGTPPNCTTPTACPEGQTGTPSNCRTASGCTVTGTLLKTATCPTKQAAEDFATTCATGSGNVPFFTVGYKATCGTEKGPITGPYSFADISTGIVSTILGYSNYHPLGSTPTNPNNGSAVVQFASVCTTDKGTTCMGAIKLPCASSVVQVITSGSSSDSSCWNISLFCTDGKTGAGGCSSNPQFTPVQTK